MMKIDNHTFLIATGIDPCVDFECSAFGLSNATVDNTLSFLDTAKFIDEINLNKNISTVVTNSGYAGNLLNKKIIIVDDPRYFFYQFLNYYSKNTKQSKPSVIAGTASIHNTSYVSPVNVIIGENTIICPNVTILEDVEIGDNCIIQSGTVIGSEGFEYKRTSKGILRVFHDGKVSIGHNVDVGANTCIDKGFSFRNTIIENDVKIDNLIHIAHGVHINRGAFIIAGTILGGSTTIGEEAWLGINASTGPGISIGRRGFVSMGAVVTKNVEDEQQVTGNLAIPHLQFLKALKKKLTDL